MMPGLSLSICRRCVVASSYRFALAVTCCLSHSTYRPFFANPQHVVVSHCQNLFGLPCDCRKCVRQARCAFAERNHTLAATCRRHRQVCAQAPLSCVPLFRDREQDKGPSSPRARTARTQTSLSIDVYAVTQVDISGQGYRRVERYVTCDSSATKPRQHNVTTRSRARLLTFRTAACTRQAASDRELTFFDASAPVATRGPKRGERAC